MSGRFNLSMLMLNTALASVAAVMWVGPLAQRTWTAPPAQPSNLDEVAQTVLIDNPVLSESFPEVVERPLLHPSRKPPPPPPPPADKAKAPPPPVALDKAKLSGIVQSAGVLWVLMEVDGKPQSLKQGDLIGEWKLESVNDRSVRFAKDGDKRDLTLPHVYTPAPGTTDEVLSLRPPPPPPPPATPTRSSTRAAARMQPAARAQDHSHADAEPVADQADDGEQAPEVVFGAPARPRLAP